MLKLWLIVSCLMLLALTVSALIEAIRVRAALRQRSARVPWREYFAMAWLIGVGTLGSLTLVRAMVGSLRS